MSHTVLLELSDDDYSIIQHMAEATGRTPAEVIVATLRRHAPSQLEATQVTESEPGPDGEPLTSAEAQRYFWAAAERMSAQIGQPPRAILAQWHADMQMLKHRQITDAERQAALAALRRFSGAVDSGDVHSADNERIDADLAREYGRGLDEET